MVMILSGMICVRLQLRKKMRGKPVTVTNAIIYVWQDIASARIEYKRCLDSYNDWITREGNLGYVAMFVPTLSDKSVLVPEPYNGTYIEIQNTYC